MKPNWLSFTERKKKKAKNTQKCLSNNSFHVQLHWFNVKKIHAQRQQLCGRFFGRRKAKSIVRNFDFFSTLRFFLWFVARLWIASFWYFILFNCFRFIRPLNGAASARQRRKGQRNLMWVSVENVAATSWNFLWAHKSGPFWITPRDKEKMVLACASSSRSIFGKL